MEEQIKSQCKNILENLTPTDNVENNGIYECSLKYGIDDENIKNIALSGAYGSGKSSILKTFEKNKNNHYEFLNISLADFSGSEKNNENLDIERSILQKMFYTVKNEEIPFSRFKRIKDITAQELQKYSLWLFIGLFWFFIAYKNKDLPEYLWFLKFDVVYIIGFIITFIALYFMLPKIISLFGNIDLKKINLKSGDVDLGQKDDSSILNKNLDEIIYFFKATNYDVVIFEDLDRYAKNITKEDRDFILSIRERRAKDYSFKLEKVDEIIKQIHNDEFDRKEVLNYNLIEYLLEKDNIKVLNQIIKQINEKKDLEFIKGYIDLEYKNIDKFIDFIIEKCIWFWDEIDKSSFTIEKKENYLKLIFKYGKIENIRKFKVSSLSNYISNINNFVQFSSDIDIKKIKDVLKIFEPAFKKVSQIDDKAELFEFIYENSFYEISFEMIEGILKQFNKNEFNLEDLDKKNLTIIKNSTCKSLIDDIEEHIEIYIENVLLNFEKICDDENILVKLFNNENISDDLKIEIIKKQETLISNISEVKDSKLWKNLFEDNKVKVDWNNILYYYQEYKEIDKSLIKYINVNENAQILSVTRINSDTQFMKNSKFDIKLVNELLKKILLTDEININSYKSLIKSNAYWYHDLDISTLNEEKIIEIVKEGKLQQTIQNFNRLKECTKEQHIKLIEKNIDKFLEKYEEYSLDEKDILKILENLNITKKIKMEIIQKIDETVICNKNIGKQIYDFMDRKVKYSVIFLENLVKNLNTIEMQVNIIVEQNQYLNEDEFILLLNLLENDYTKICNFDGKQTVLKDNYYNKKLIEILHSRKFITKDKEDKDKTIRLYIKLRR